MKNTKIIFVVVLLVFSECVWSNGDWYWKGSADALQRSYSGSVYYDGLTGFGVHVARDYLEQLSVTFGYNYNEKQYKSGLTNAPNQMEENIVFFSAGKNFHASPIMAKHA